MGPVSVPPPSNFIARTPNSSWLKNMYQGNSAQISPSVMPSAATVRSLRRSRFACRRLRRERHACLLVANNLVTRECNADR